MTSVIIIFIFVILIAFPGFYIITRKVFPHQSKKLSSWLAGILTALLILFLLGMMKGMLS